MTNSAITIFEWCTKWLVNIYLNGAQNSEVESTLARSLRDAGADFNRLLFDRLRAFHSAADGVQTQHPVHHTVTTPNTRWRHWDGATSQLILDLLHDVLDVSHSLRRPPETVRLRSTQPVTRQGVPNGHASSSIISSSVFGGTSNSRQTSRYGTSTGNRRRPISSDGGNSSRRHRTSNLGSARNQLTNLTLPGEHGGSRVSYVNVAGVHGNFDTNSTSRPGGSTVNGNASALNYATTDAGQCHDWFVS